MCTTEGLCSTADLGTALTINGTSVKTFQLDDRVSLRIFLFSNVVFMTVWPRIRLTYLYHLEFFFLSELIVDLSIFNCRIMAVQYRVGLCHVPARISHKYTHVPLPLELPSTSLPTPMLQVVSDHWCEFPES